MMTTIRGFLFVLSTFFSLLASSQAWTGTACAKPPSFSRGCTTPLHATHAPSSALFFQSGNEEASTFSINDELDTEIRLRVALQAARDADRRYGLCTPESVDAWKVVDDIYSSSSASRQVEDSVKKVLGHREESVWSLFERRYAV